MVRALVSYRGDPGSIPSEGTGNVSAMLYFVTAIMSSDNVQFLHLITEKHLEMLGFRLIFVHQIHIVSISFKIKKLLKFHV